MSFFKKAFRSFLDLSNREDQRLIQHHGQRRNIPSPTNGLSLISVADGIQAPANVLQSVTVKSVAASADAGNEDHGEITTGDNVHKSAAGISGTNRSGWAGLLAEGGANRFELHTESLAFESLCELMNGGVLTVMPSSSSPVMLTAGSRSRTTMARTRREKVKRKDFPPFLSSLNKNGRPRFNLTPVREDGRLKITQVLNNRPGIVRNRRRDGRLRMKLMSSDQDDDEEEEASQCEDDGDEEKKREEDKEGGGGDGKLTERNGDGSRRFQQCGGINLVHLWCPLSVCGDRFVEVSVNVL